MVIKKKVLLLGAFGSINLGDETILSSILSYYSDNEDLKYQVTVFCSDASYVSYQFAQHDGEVLFISYLNVLMWELIGLGRYNVDGAITELMLRSRYDYKLRMVLEIIRSADIVHIGGGGYLKSSYPHILAVLLSVIRFCPNDCFISITGVSVGPFWEQEKCHDYQVHEIFSRANFIDCRDDFGNDFLNNNSLPFHITCDDVFFYKKTNNNRKAKNSQKYIINFQISRVFNGKIEFSEKILSGLHFFLRRIEGLEQKYKLNFISYATTEGDWDIVNYANLYIKYWFPNLETSVIMGELFSLDQIVYQLGQGVLNIGCRFHFYVHSLMAGNDCIGLIGNESSFRHTFLLKQCGIGSLVDLRDTVPEEISEVLIEKLNCTGLPGVMLARKEAVLTFLDASQTMKQAVFDNILLNGR